MRAGILIGTVAMTLGVIASGAPASAEPCPPEVCSIPGLPGLPGGALPFLPSSMSDLPPQLSQYPGGGDRPWDQGDSANIFNTPAPDAPYPAQLPPGLVEQGKQWMNAATGEPNSPAYPQPAPFPGG